VRLLAVRLRCVHNGMQLEHTPVAVLLAADSKTAASIARGGARLLLSCSPPPAMRDNQTTQSMRIA
jgi:hypothetical protein